MQLKRTSDAPEPHSKRVSNASQTHQELTSNSPHTHIHHRAESFLPPHTYGLHSQLGSILDAGHRFPCIFAGGLISSGTKHILLYSITESKKLTRPLEVANAVQMHARILWGVRGVSFSIAGAIINSLVFVVCVLGGRNYRHTDVCVSYLLRCRVVFAS